MVRVLFAALLGLLFKKNVAQALTVLSSCIGLAAVFSTLSIAYGWLLLVTKIYIAIGLSVLSLICYAVLELILKYELL